MVCIVRDLLKRDGDLICRATDTDRIDLISITGLPEDTNYVINRRRRVIVAKNRQGICGYGFLESATDGINIFSLYDTCRFIIFSSEGSPESKETRDALFAEAFEHYRKMGKKSFLYLKSPDDAPVPENVSSFRIPLVRIIMKRNIIPRLSEHGDTVMSIPSAKRRNKN